MRLSGKDLKIKKLFYERFRLNMKFGGKGKIYKFRHGKI